MPLVMEKAVFAADHHGNLAHVNIGKEALPHLTLPPIRIIDKGRLYMDIYEQGRGICEIAKTGIVGHHG